MGQNSKQKATKIYISTPHSYDFKPILADEDLLIFKIYKALQKPDDGLPFSPLINISSTICMYMFATRLSWPRLALDGGISLRVALNRPVRTIAVIEPRYFCIVKKHVIHL